MTKYRFRRLPVVSDDVLYGIVTATDIMRYLGSREVFSRLTTGNVAEVTGLAGPDACSRIAHHHNS